MGFVYSCKKEPLIPPPCFGSAIDIDGNRYTTLTIKDDEWTLKNLTVSRFNNGDTIIEAQTDAEWEYAIYNSIPAWCHYDNDSTNGEIYGKIYNYHAIVDSRGLAPEGWHISTESEWYNLEDNFGGEWNAGLHLKAEFGWSDNGNGDNESYFTGLPGGTRWSIGTFYGLGTSGHWWTSTPESSFSNFSALMPSINNLLNINSQDFTYGLSVRCVKD